MCQKEYRMHLARILANSGHKQAEIAQKLGVSDRMVRKYLQPNYQPKARKARPSQLDPFKTIIGSVLEDNPYFNIVVLAKRLRTLGYQGGLSILRDYAATVRSGCIARAVIRFETEPGRQAQVDWKECGRWFLDGEERKLYAFVMLLGYSRKPFVLFTTGMSSPILLAAHNRAFEYFQGVPAEILYDNMKTAWLADGDGWKVNPKLLKYAEQVGFKPLRCQVRRPQTKGKVERFIGYLDNHFLPEARQRGLASLSDLNAAVREWLVRVDQEELREFCETRSVRFEKERACLGPWIGKAAPAILASQDLLVSREGTVSFETNRYSVPADLIGKLVCLRHDPLGREATIHLGDKELYRLNLLPAGGRKCLIRPQDAESLRARWKRENRRLRVAAKTVSRPAEPPQAQIEIEVATRHPDCYERLLEGA